MKVKDFLKFEEIKTLSKPSPKSNLWINLPTYKSVIFRNIIKVIAKTLQKAEKLSKSDDEATNITSEPNNNLPIKKVGCYLGWHSTSTSRLS